MTTIDTFDDVCPVCAGIYRQQEQEQREAVSDAMYREVLVKSRTMELLRKFEQKHIAAGGKKLS